MAELLLGLARELEGILTADSSLFRLFDMGGRPREVDRLGAPRTDPVRLKDPRPPRPRLALPRK